jgi:hypothetical protein
MFPRSLPSTSLPPAVSRSMKSPTYVIPVYFFPCLAEKRRSCLSFHVFRIFSSPSGWTRYPSRSLHLPRQPPPTARSAPVARPVLALAGARIRPLFWPFALAREAFCAYGTGYWCTHYGNASHAHFKTSCLLSCGCLAVHRRLYKQLEHSVKALCLHPMTQFLSFCLSISQGWVSGRSNHPTRRKECHRAR